MKNVLFAALTSLLYASFAISEEPRVGDELGFRIVGTFEGVSTDSYQNVHGEEWSLIIDVDELLSGSYDRDKVYVGVPNRQNYGLELGHQYYFEIVIGGHGLRMVEHRKVE